MTTTLSSTVEDDDQGRSVSQAQQEREDDDDEDSEDTIQQVNFEMIFRQINSPPEIRECIAHNNSEFTLPHDASFESRISHTDVPLNDEAASPDLPRILTTGAHEHNRCWMMVILFLGIVFVAVYVSPKTLSDGTPESNNQPPLAVDQWENPSITPSLSPI